MHVRTRDPSRRVVFLDVDGVLNRSGYRPAGESQGLRSWIEPELAANLCAVLRATTAHVVLSSDWRLGREQAKLEAELEAAGITCRLLGTTPVLGDRWREIEAWMLEHDATPQSVVIVDDAVDMGPLAERFVHVSPLTGLDTYAVSRVLRLFGLGIWLETTYVLC